jgi:hypothetical protein
MKKPLLTLTALLFTAALATTSFAGNQEGKAGGAFMGKVSASADGTLTVANKKKGDQTFKTSAQTKITRADGTAGTAADLKVGSLVKVVPGTSPDQAAEIKLAEPKKKEGKPEAAKPDAPKTTE